MKKGDAVEDVKLESRGNYGEGNKDMAHSIAHFLRHEPRAVKEKHTVYELSRCFFPDPQSAVVLRGRGVRGVESTARPLAAPI